MTASTTAAGTLFANTLAKQDYNGFFESKSYGFQPKGKGFNAYPGKYVYVAIRKPGA
ncbi:hypothetical protein [Fulvimarina manganoxydans]|uniref:hypothetical protein n=1 Tax=Fulvimarina manganoxydans TaxID=937218 RepID=UPI001483CB79|nr:hypothetical protein [Fulvimarina manganoxydans]